MVFAVEITYYKLCVCVCVQVQKQLILSANHRQGDILLTLCYIFVRIITVVEFECIIFCGTGYTNVKAFKSTIIIFVKINYVLSFPSM